MEQLIAAIHHEHYSIRRLVKNRLGLTVKNLAQRKLLIESQKEIALTDKPIQEVAYDMGFSDPAYFNRFFKGHTRLTPLESRETFGNPSADTFVQDLLFLIHQHHTTVRSTSFYAVRHYPSPFGSRGEGYSPVSYIDLDLAQRGSKAFKAEYDGLTYYFTDAEQKAKFETNPTKYTPEFGGWCATGIAVGKKFRTDPHKFLVRNGQLYLISVRPRSGCQAAVAEG